MNDMIKWNLSYYIEVIPLMFDNMIKFINTNAYNFNKNSKTAKTANLLFCWSAKNSKNSKIQKNDNKLKYDKN